jgi:hypothetical protein
MEIKSELTIFKLLNFILLNDNEKELFNFDKNVIDEFKKDLNKNMFYLGGQIKMKPDEPINLNSIHQVLEINKRRDIEYGGPCNSFEADSILNHLGKLIFIKNMIISYNSIIELREKEDLNKCNSDK